VSGSIAAFKGAALASALVREGYAVRAAMTPGALHFVSPLTYEALTGSPVSVEVWDEQSGTAMGHLDLARWADVVVIAPASAGVIARIALGLTDDMLCAATLAFRGPIVVAPAMESAMFRHPATQLHIETLRTRGAMFVGPETGRLASGEDGEGRMTEPEEIVSVVRALLETGDLAGRRVLVTAGPTLEPLDSVRFIGNRSSGKMGYALAGEARRRGAHVLLITGPTSLPEPDGIEVKQVETAEQMRGAVLEAAAGMDVVIMAAAVADFRAERPSEGKIKREGSLRLDLVPTEDIAVAAVRNAPNAVHVGFALEVDDLENGARAKLESKGLHLVVGNLVSREHGPFGSETNEVTLVGRESLQRLREMTKREVATRVLDEVVKLLA
jgi:phosphopantothenoylcysteine decarboxylase/phosphopantothenate--cysteine ligase